MPRTITFREPSPREEGPPELNHHGASSRLRPRAVVRPDSWRRATGDLSPREPTLQPATTITGRHRGPPSLRASAPASHLQITTVARTAPTDQFRPGTQNQQCSQYRTRLAPLGQPPTPPKPPLFDPRAGVRPRAAQTASLASTKRAARIRARRRTQAAPRLQEPRFEQEYTLRVAGQSVNRVRF